MRLAKVRVTNYRSVRDSGWIDVEHGKTIFVGPNEAGKSAILQAVQQINAPSDIGRFEALRDYPRSAYNDITTGKVKPQDVVVVEAHFRLDASDLTEIGSEFADVVYCFRRLLDNSGRHWLEGGPVLPTFADVQPDLVRLAAHFDGSHGSDARDELSTLTSALALKLAVPRETAEAIDAWLVNNIPNLDEDNAKENERLNKVRGTLRAPIERDKALAVLHDRLPLFVLFNNYFRVRPRIHLAHLAERLRTNVLDDTQYDYGNSCLLKLLGFAAQDLADLGNAAAPPPGDGAALKAYQDQLDSRTYQLNAASVRLTEEIKRVWNPDTEKGEASRLRVQADGQYLKVVVEDDLGVEVELDQRSEGFQWLVSFFVVFFAEAQGEHENAILLLDEPGMSLHGLKQREFRITLSRLAAENQTVFTTHSPFLVGPDELDIVRVVEMPDRTTGTKVHETVTAGDPAALLPLQEALGYDLAQSLFAQERNLILEGLTDYWYLEAMSQLLGGGKSVINDRIALVPASSAGKVTYFATILHAHNLKVSALLDSDAAGEAAANQDTLVHTLGNKRILRTKDYYSGPVQSPEIEDLLRATLLRVAEERWGVDASAQAAKQESRPIVDVLTDQVPDFSKYHLAKAFLRWAREHEESDLTADEASQFRSLMEAINKGLK